jgi:hypothetical protein
MLKNIDFYQRRHVLRLSHLSKIKFPTRARTCVCRDPNRQEAEGALRPADALFFIEVGFRKISVIIVTNGFLKVCCRFHSRDQANLFKSNSRRALGFDAHTICMIDSFWGLPFNAFVFTYVHVLQLHRNSRRAPLLPRGNPTFKYFM